MHPRARSGQRQRRINAGRCCPVDIYRRCGSKNIRPQLQVDKKGIYSQCEIVGSGQKKVKEESGCSESSINSPREGGARTNGCNCRSLAMDGRRRYIRGTDTIIPAAPGRASASAITMSDAPGPRISPANASSVSGLSAATAHWRITLLRTGVASMGSASTRPRQSVAVKATMNLFTGSLPLVRFPL